MFNVIFIFVQPDGMGVFKAAAPSWAPPQNGWKSLAPEANILPASVATFREISK